MKMNKKWIAVIMLVVMVFALTACGEKKEETKPTEAPKATIVGVWQMDIESLLTMAGISAEEYEMVKSAGGFEITLEFTADGKAIMTTTAMGQSQVDESTYSVNGDVLTMDGSDGTYKIEGNKLTLSQGELTLNLTRK